MGKVITPIHSWGRGTCRGSVWEGAMAAANYKLDNLTAIIDRNSLQISGRTEDVMSVEPLADKWRAFGWNVIEVDGNDPDKLQAILKQLM